MAAAALPGPHRDPWDRIMMAQALAENLADLFEARDLAQGFLEVVFEGGFEFWIGGCLGDFGQGLGDLVLG